MNDFQAASCRYSASAAAWAGLKMSLPLEWFFFVLIASSFQMTMSSISLLFNHPFLSN